MIVAAGLGLRLRPLTHLRPKPALPVGGVPLIAYTLAWLRAHGVTEVAINVHHLPEILESAALAHCPPGMQIRFSREETLLDTGGGISRLSSFLRESDPCVLVSGDMLIDADLGALIARHRHNGDAITLLLREESRMRDFGSIGVDGSGRVRRIATRLDLGSEERAGLYTWVNVVSPRAFDSLPARSTFSHLDDWIAPLLRGGANDIRGELDLACTWEPVGTLPEYLRANLEPPELSYLEFLHPPIDSRTFGKRDLVVGAGAQVSSKANLRASVVWDGETVAAGVRGENGVFAGGRFHSAAVSATAGDDPANGGRP